MLASTRNSKLLPYCSSLMPHVNKCTLYFFLRNKCLSLTNDQSVTHQIHSVFTIIHKNYMSLHKNCLNFIYCPVQVLPVNKTNRLMQLPHLIYLLAPNGCLPFENVISPGALKRNDMVCLLQWKNMPWKQISIQSLVWVHSAHNNTVK